MSMIKPTSGFVATTITQLHKKILGYITSNVYKMSILSNIAIHFLSRNISGLKNVHQLSNKCTRIPKYRTISTKSRSKQTSKGMFKIGLAGITVGAVVGTGYSIHYMNQPRAHILNEEIVLSPLETIPEITPSKSVSFNKIL